MRPLVHVVGVPQGLRLASCSRCGCPLPGLLERGTDVLEIIGDGEYASFRAITSTESRAHERCAPRESPEERDGRRSG